MEFFAGLVRLAVVGTICIGIGDLVLYAIIKFRDRKKKKQENHNDSPASEDTKKEGVL